MQLVYATGQTRERDFQIASALEAIPAGARVFATCTGEKVVEHIGEITFQNMTDEEFYNMRAMAREARERAQQQQSARSDEAAAPAWTLSLRRLLNTLFGQNRAA